MAEKAQAPRGAVLQFEIDRKRVAAYPDDVNSYGENNRAAWRWRGIAHQALNDTLANGGTFVVVASPDKVTIVQRPDADEGL